MFRNYFITALRNILGNRIQSFIQVLSLAIGITAAVLIGLYVKNELTYDRFNEKFDRIYRLEYSDHVGLPTAPGYQIKQAIPEVENVVRMVNWHGKDYAFPFPYIPGHDSTDLRIIKIEDHIWCDSTIFEVFSFNFLQGDPKTALRDPYSVVLTQSTARRIFGDIDPVGQSLGRNWLTVTGVIEDVKHSHIEVNMLISITSNDTLSDYARGDYEYLNNYYPDYSYITYVLLREGYDRSYVEGRINDYFTGNMPVNALQVSEGKRFSLRPMEDIYFATGLKEEKNFSRHGNLKLLRVLLTIAVFILVLAVINYINLTTARASLRAREVGIRKVTGSTENQLIFQFLVESVFITLVSLMIALVIVYLLLPGFNQLAFTELDLETMARPGPLAIYILAAILLGVISGIYPAVFMTGFKPIASLSGEKVKGSGSAVFRRVLLTFQFAISIVLIIGVLVIFMQLKYMKTADLGFNMNGIVNNAFYLFGSDPLKRQLLKQELMQNPNIRGVAFSMEVMGGNESNLVQPVEVNGVEKQITVLQVDPDFFDVLEIKLLDGRNFSWDRAGDYMAGRGNQSAKMMMNETAAREFEIESPVGYFERFENGLSFEIIGLVKDFNFKSLHEKIEPCIYYWGTWIPTSSIRIAHTDIPATINYIKEVIQSLYPQLDEEAIECTFLEETYNRQYLRDERTARIIIVFAIIAVLIACLGLFGLSTFMAARRTKEIGIRKVMGASEQSVYFLLAREFVRWVVLSILIACPVAWSIMNKWLQSYAYRTNISWWIFAATILIAFAITFLTVTWQSLKSARTKPVDALRYE
jgi:putative ABC transport system permease protein